MFQERILNLDICHREIALFLALFSGMSHSSCCMIGLDCWRVSVKKTLTIVGLPSPWLLVPSWIIRILSLGKSRLSPFRNWKESKDWERESWIWRLRELKKSLSKLKPTDMDIIEKAIAFLGLDKWMKLIHKKWLFICPSINIFYLISTAFIYYH